MNFLALFFICIKMYAFLNTRELAYFIHNFSLMLQARRRNPKIKQVVIMDKGSMFMAFYFLADILFLVFCIILMFDDATWQPGCLLLIISAMESYAMHSHISGTYVIDKLGFTYPQIWFKYLMSGQTLYILLNLFQTL